MDKALEGSKTPTLTVWIVNAHENVFSLIFMKEWTVFIYTYINMW